MSQHFDRSLLSRALAVTLLWAVLFLPSIERRAVHWEEGRHALAARDTLHQNHWVAPEVYGVRFIQKPPLFPALIAAVGWLLGGVSTWAVRLLPLLAVLQGGYLVLAMTGRQASPVASIVAVGCWFLNPAILVKARVGEPDVINAVLLFAAFVVWWTGVGAGRVTRRRWMGCGLLLTGAAAMKGPQHVAYFGLGVLLYMAVTRSWRDLPGLLASLALPALFTGLWGWAVYQPGVEHEWLVYMRLSHDRWVAREYALNILDQAGILALQLSPGIALAVLLWVPAVRRARDRRHDVALALLLYAAATTVIILVWPGARSRYVLPAFPAVAVAAGLMTDRLLAQHRPTLIKVTCGVLAGLMLYQLSLVLVVMRWWPELFLRNQRVGETIGAIIAQRPGPVFITAPAFHNVVYYCSSPMRYVSPGHAATLASPSWIVAGRGQTREIRAMKAGGMDVVFESDDPPFVLLRSD